MTSSGHTAFALMAKVTGHLLNQHGFVQFCKEAYPPGALEQQRQFPMHSFLSLQVMGVASRLTL